MQTMSCRHRLQRCSEEVGNARLRQMQGIEETGCKGVAKKWGMNASGSWKELKRRALFSKSAFKYLGTPRARRNECVEKADQEEKDVNRSYPIALYCMFLPTLLYLLSGIVMVPHYFQFLTPLLFLLVAVLPSQLKSKTLRKIAYCGVTLVVINQACFSYWRSWEEYLSLIHI